MNINELKQQLLDEKALQFGDFVLKSGKKSSVYLDMRSCFSSPSLFRSVVNAYHSIVDPLNFDLVCGVPYAALPFAAALAYEHSFPQILSRKEPKKYGMKKKVEGTYAKGQKCLIIEDVVTTGGSIITLAKELEDEGLIIQDLVAFADRQEGAKELIESNGYKLHTVLTLKDLLENEPCAKS